MSDRRLRQLQDDLWVIDHPFRTGGLHLGTRTTLVRTGEGLWMHSPGPLDRGVEEEIRGLGEVAHIVAPNTMHYLFYEQNKAAFPAATGWAGAALRKKAPALPVDHGLEHARWDGLQALAVAGLPRLEETVFFHAATRTLVLTDLVFNIQQTEHWPTKAFMKVNGAYGRFGPTRVLRHIITSDARALGESVAQILDWDFDRVILGHGEVLPTGGREALRASFDWALSS